MQWLNEPASWQRTGGVLTVSVDPGTDFWRQTGYGYIRDSGHVYGEVLAGDLDVSVRIRGTLDTQYDQAGIMLRADEQTWLKTGVEFFEGQPRLSTVLTLGRSSWTVTSLPEDVDEIVLRVARRGDAVEVRYATGPEEPAQLAAMVFMPPGCEVLAGVMCAAPEGPGFIVTFHDLYIAGADWAADGAGPGRDAGAGTGGWADPATEPWAEPAAGAGRRWLEPEEAAAAQWAEAGTPATGWAAAGPADPAGAGLHWPEPGERDHGPGQPAMPEAGTGWAAAAQDGEWPRAAGRDEEPGEPAAGPATGGSPQGAGDAAPGRDGQDEPAAAGDEPAAGQAAAAGQPAAADGDDEQDQPPPGPDPAEAGSVPDVAAGWDQPDGGEDWMTLATSAQARHWIAALASDLGSDWPGPPVPQHPVQADPVQGGAGEPGTGHTGSAAPESAAAPGDAAAGGAVPDGAVPDGAVPDGAVPGAARAEQGAPGTAGPSAELPAGPPAGWRAGPPAGWGAAEPAAGARSAAAASGPDGPALPGEEQPAGHLAPPADALGDTNPDSLPAVPPARSPAGRPGPAADDATDPHLRAAPGPPAATSPDPGPPANGKTGKARDEDLAAAEEWISLLTTDPD